MGIPPTHFKLTWTALPTCKPPFQPTKVLKHAHLYHFLHNHFRKILEIQTHMSTWRPPESNYAIFEPTNKIQENTNTPLYSQPITNKNAHGLPWIIDNALKFCGTTNCYNNRTRGKSINTNPHGNAMSNFMQTPCCHTQQNVDIVRMPIFFPFVVHIEMCACRQDYSST